MCVWGGDSPITAAGHTHWVAHSVANHPRRAPRRGTRLRLKRDAAALVEGEAAAVERLVADDGEPVAQRDDEGRVAAQGHDGAAPAARRPESLGLYDHRGR